MAPRRVVVVVPTLNERPTLSACLESIRDTAGHPDWELVVVDGGSTDGSLEWLERQAWLTIMKEPRRGVAPALNSAFRAARDADVVRVHADVVFETKGWLAILAEAARSLPKAGVVGAKLVYPDDRIHSVGRNFVTGVGLVDRHANLKRFAPDDGKGGDPVEVDSVPGALAYLTREAIEATGGLDEEYRPVYLDDDDFCFAARHRGFKVYAHPGVKAVHYSPVWGPTTHHPIHDPDGLVFKVMAFRDAVLSSHAERFESKWGFNPRFPDLAEVRRLYGGTEVCWRIGEPMRFTPREWPPAVDLVMVTWNNRATLERCLASLAQTRYPKLRLHVTDNGSKDGTVDWLRGIAETFPFPVEVHALPVNAGVAVGFNWSIVKGDAELVARIDDDVIVPPDWLEKLVEGFRTRPYAGCVGPKILNDNANADIQCGPYRMYPSVYGHDREPDAGQADYLARCAHVRGCCNVYRRDVLEKVGLFDLRFSPSQYDDPDHHAALLAAGYEILYEGRVAVVHALQSGAGLSFAALSNKWANRDKLFGKWGGDIWNILDRALDESREGRYLPDDGDTSAYLATLPGPEAYPRLDAKRANEATRSRIERILRVRDLTLSLGGHRQYYWDDVLDQTRALRRDGFFQSAADLLHSLIDVVPAHPVALLELSESYEAMGDLSRAEKLLLRAVRLDPANADARRRLAETSDRIVVGQSASRAALSAPADKSAEIGESIAGRAAKPSGKSLRVLMVNTFERRTAGGDMHQVKKTRQALEKEGIEVDVAYAPRPDPRGYDLVHVWNLWFPAQTLPQVKGIRVALPRTPIALSPIYWDMAEKAWSDMAIMSVFRSAETEAELRERLKHLANGTLSINGLRRTDRREPNFTGYEDYQRQILELVDHCLPNSEAEMRNLETALGVRPPSFTVVRNAAESEVFDAATGEWFEREYGVKDFVVTVGLVESRKNQLMLLHALAETSIPVVVIGRNYDRNYLRLCQRFAGDKHKTIFIEHLPHDRLASALKAARVFALPSWMECCSFANVGAALAGCSLVVSDRTSEPEYFGEAAYYCDPASVESIRDAVVAAFENRDADAPKRARLRELFTRKYTWKNAALRTIEGYRRAFAARGLPFPHDAATETAARGGFETVLA